MAEQEAGKRTAEANQRLAQARREALEEATGALAAASDNQVAIYHGRRHIAQRKAVEIVRALMDQPPPDTGERDRRPTPAEEEAHDGWWIVRVLGEAEVVRVPKYSKRVGSAWRPVTRELWPAPWPNR